VKKFVWGCILSIGCNILLFCYTESIFISSIKMYKQLWWFFVFSLIFLSGCSQQYSVEDAIIVHTAIQKSFLYSDVFSLMDENPFSASGIVRESLGLYSKTSSDILSSDIELALTTDSSTSNKFSSIVFSWAIQDKAHSDVFNGSGSIHYISTGEKEYINRQEGYIDLWPGNTESFVVRMILDAVRSQWMLIDDGNLINTAFLSPIDGATVLNILGWIRDIVRKEGLLIPTSSSVAGLYPLVLSESGDMNAQIQWLYAMMGKEKSNIDLSFIGSIQTIPEAKLVIENFHDSNDNRSISGYIWVRNGSVILEQETNIRTIDRQERKWSVKLEVSMKQNNKEPIVLSIRITPKSIANALWWLAYEWEMRLALSDNNILTFPIAGLYGIYIVDETQFLEPTRYILMSQLFGDEYGIARILESE